MDAIISLVGGLVLLYVLFVLMPAWARAANETRNYAWGCFGVVAILAACAAFAFWWWS